MDISGPTTLSVFHFELGALHRYGIRQVFNRHDFVAVKTKVQTPVERKNSPPMAPEEPASCCKRAAPKVAGGAGDGEE